MARERMRKFHDKKKEQQPDFQVGDKVLLNAKNVKTLRPSKKLDQRMRGPWKIIKRVGPRAFQLDMKEYKGRCSGNGAHYPGGFRCGSAEPRLRLCCRLFSSALEFFFL